MVGRFTNPFEVFDGNGDDYDREIALIKQNGGIRLRDKDVDGEIPKRNLTRHRCYTNSPEYKKDQQARIEAHRRRILAQERLLRAEGIKSCHTNTAGKFDELAI